MSKIPGTQANKEAKMEQGTGTGMGSGSGDFALLQHEVHCVCPYSTVVAAL